MMFPQAVLFFGRVDASGCVDSRTEFLISPLQLVDPAAAADVPFSGVFRQECGVEVRATLQSLKDVEKFAMAIHDTMVNFPHDSVIVFVPNGSSIASFTGSRASTPTPASIPAATITL